MLISDQKAKYILDLGFKSEKLSILNEYLKQLIEKNKEINLFSRKMQFEELIDNHVIDSLLPLKHLPKSFKLAADFGSGGGFPAAIYAIHFDQAQFYLYEKSKLKRDFLDSLKHIIPNLSIFEMIDNKIPACDFITSRAFKSIEETVGLSFSYYDKGGRYYFLKGRFERIQDELDLARKNFKDIYSEVIGLKSPALDVERHLVIVSKK